MGCFCGDCSKLKRKMSAEGDVCVKTVDDLSEAMKVHPTRAHVVDFSATWCGPCRILEPKLKEMRAKYPNVVIVKVDVDEGEDLVTMYDVSVVPTFVVFKEGTVVETLVGSDVEKVEELFKKYNS